MLTVTLLVFSSTFWEEFHRILFTEEPRAPSDYTGFLLAIASIIVIITTDYRLLDHIARLSVQEIKKIAPVRRSADNASADRKWMIAAVYCEIRTR
jgi:hypothetical protein